jgi:hypothetical protein
MHPFFSDVGSASASWSFKQWLDVWGGVIFAGVNIFLTGAIAYAGVQQWKVGNRLYSLQKSVEADRSKVWFFHRVKAASPLHDGAILEISNLNETGAWLEQVKVVAVFGSPRQVMAKAVVLQTIIPNWNTEQCDLAPTILQLIPRDVLPINVLVYVEIEMWAKGQHHVEQTNQYCVDVSPFLVRGLSKV